MKLQYSNFALSICVLILAIVVWLQEQSQHRRWSTLPSVYLIDRHIQKSFLLNDPVLSKLNGRVWVQLNSAVVDMFEIAYPMIMQKPHSANIWGSDFEENNPCVYEVLISSSPASRQLRISADGKRIVLGREVYDLQHSILDDLAKYIPD